MAAVSREDTARLAKQDKGPETVAIISSFMALAIICVGLRTFTRLKITKMFGIEDAFIVLPVISTITLSVLQFKQVEWGTGKHLMFLDWAHVEQMSTYLWCSIPAYFLALTFVRLSILLQYRRIFITSQGIWTANTIVMAICVVYGIESVLVGIFQCNPINGFWDVHDIGTESCIDEIAWYWANAGLNVAIDLLIAALPVRAIWRLQVPKKQKIALEVILTIGWLVCIVSMLRLHSLILLKRHPEDASWYGAAPAYLSAIEVNLAIVCASLPALKPLVARVIPDFVARRLSITNKTRRTWNTASDCPTCVPSGGNNSRRATGDGQSENDVDGDVALASPLSSYGTDFVMEDIEPHMEPGVCTGDYESSKEDLEKGSCHA